MTELLQKLLCDMLDTALGFYLLTYKIFGSSLIGLGVTLRKESYYSELFWSVFSRIRTEYGEIWSIFPYSFRMPINTDQNNSEYGHAGSIMWKTPTRVEETLIKCKLRMHEKNFIPVCWAETLALLYMGGLGFLPCENGLRVSM